MSAGTVESPLSKYHISPAEAADVLFPQVHEGDALFFASMEGPLEIGVPLLSGRKLTLYILRASGFSVSPLGSIPKTNYDGDDPGGLPPVSRAQTL